MKRRLKSWFGLAAFVALSAFPTTGAVSLALPHSHAKPAEAPTDWIDKTKAIIEAGAIVVGGIWTWMLFVKKRQRFPRAAITHAVDFRKLNDDYWLAHVTVTVKNPGEVLLKLVSHRTQVQVVVPPDKRVSDALAKNEDPVPEGKSEYPWPHIKNIESNWSAETETREIEPGESQDVDVDFFVPAVVETIMIYSYFENKTKRKKNRELGWDCTTIHDVQRNITGITAAANVAAPSAAPSGTSANEVAR